MAAARWLLVAAVAAAALLATCSRAAAPRKPVDVQFQKNYVPTWAADHIHYADGGREVQLYLDRNTGTGFQTRGSYLFGHFSMHMKLVGGDSAGTVTAFYLSSQNSEHDEIDFEFLGNSGGPRIFVKGVASARQSAFTVGPTGYAGAHPAYPVGPPLLGNRTGQPYILQTNVFTGGKGDREQRIYLWFDPTKEYHSYSVLWNLYMIAFFVDDVPIRVFKNSSGDLGVRYPFSQPMKLYSSLWNADDWATRGGREKTDWSNAPFVASYRGFHVDGCEASAEARFCATQGARWWDQPEFRDLDGAQYRKLREVRQRYTIYNYCTDRDRYAAVPPECAKDRDV